MIDTSTATSRRCTLLASYALPRAQERRATASSSARAWSASARSRRRRILLTNVPADYIQITSGPRRGAAAQHHRAAGALRGPGEGRDRARVVRAASARPTRPSSISSRSRSASCSTRSRRTCARRTCSSSRSRSRTSCRASRKSCSRRTRSSRRRRKLLAEQNVEVERKNQEVEQARQALEEKAEQLALTSKYKSEFLANMSHELRTPLNSLLILSEQLCDERRTATSRRSRSSSRRRSTRRATTCSTLINDILDLSKIESGTVVGRRRATSRSRDLARLRRAHVPPRRRAQEPRLRRSSIDAGAAARRCTPTRSACSRSSRTCSRTRSSSPSAAASRCAIGVGDRAAGARQRARSNRAPRGDRVLGHRHRHRHPAGEAADHLRGVPAGRRHARAASTAARASASRSAARSRACSAARSGSSSAPGEGSTFTLYLPQSYVAADAARGGAMLRPQRDGAAPRHADAAAGTPTPVRRAPTTSSTTTATTCSRTTASLLIVEDDAALRDASCSTWRTSSGFKARRRHAGRGGARAGARAPAGRHHARHPPARHRRLARARPPEGRPRARGTSRCTSSRPTRSASAALAHGALGVVAKPVSSERLDAGVRAARATSSTRPVKQPAAGRGRRRPARAASSS